MNVDLLIGQIIRLKHAMPRQIVEYAHDPIPAKAIRISEAFEHVLEAINANPKILETLNSRLQRDLRQSRKMDEAGDNWKHASEAEKREFHREKESTVFFRDRRRKRELLTYVRDPDTGEILQLNSRDWHPTARPLFKPLRVPVGMDDLVITETEGVTMAEIVPQLVVESSNAFGLSGFDLVRHDRLRM
jgi:hypothetical protein